MSAWGCVTLSPHDSICSPEPPDREALPHIDGISQLQVWNPGDQFVSQTPETGLASHEPGAWREREAQTGGPRTSHQQASVSGSASCCVDGALRWVSTEKLALRGHLLQQGLLQQGPRAASSACVVSRACAPTDGHSGDICLQLGAARDR